MEIKSFIQEINRLLQEGIETPTKSESTLLAIQAIDNIKQINGRHIGVKISIRKEYLYVWYGDGVAIRNNNKMFKLSSASKAELVTLVKSAIHYKNHESSNQYQIIFWDRLYIHLQTFLKKRFPYEKDAIWNTNEENIKSLKEELIELKNRVDSVINRLDTLS